MDRLSLKQIVYPVCPIHGVENTKQLEDLVLSDTTMPMVICDVCHCYYTSSADIFGYKVSQSFMHELKWTPHVVIINRKKES